MSQCKAVRRLVEPANRALHPSRGRIRALEEISDGRKRGELHKGGSGIDAKGKNNNLDASGQPASLCHAWGPPPRVVEGPVRPGC